MIIDHPKVRAFHTCPRCDQHKDKGLLLCWPCHRQEKRMNGGGYSAQTLALLDKLEASEVQ